MPSTSLFSIYFVIFIIDIVTFFFVWVASFMLRFEVIIDEEVVPKFSDYYLHMFILATVWFLTSFYSRYKNHQNHKKFSFANQILRVLYNSCLSFLILVSISFFLKGFVTLDISRLFLIIFWVSNTFFLLVTHVAIFPFLLFFRNNVYPIRAYILGKGNFVDHISSKITSSIVNPFSIIDRYYIPIEEMSSFAQECSRKNIKNIFLTEGYNSNEMQQIVRILANSHINIHYCPSFNIQTYLPVWIEQIEDIPVLHLVYEPMSKFKLLIKRCFDLIFSTITLVLGMPVFIIIGILIKMSSKGPIFYVQKRMSVNGKLFNMYKFRTMNMNNEEEEDDVKWTSKEDPRIFKLGRILRKSSFDELPQFYNVLLGNMSVVGPRPERPIFIEEFKKNYPQYMLRHKMKGGITGWAQVNGYRGNTSLVKRIEYDLFYINNWSFFFDMKIVSLTIIKGFFNENAY